MIMRYFVHLAYNGKNYCGWQIQDQAPTLQSELEHAKPPLPVAAEPIPVFMLKISMPILTCPMLLICHWSN